MFVFILFLTIIFYFPMDNPPPFSPVARSNANRSHTLDARITDTSKTQRTGVEVQLRVTCFHAM